MQTQSINPNSQPAKEEWSKPRVEIISVNEETLGLGIDPDKIIHFFEGS
jgi:hypothetical protein